MLRKSQVALEFLTTYAWAFLVITIMIGALYYFGIVDVGNILPDKCTFGSEFGCIDYYIDGGDPGNDVFQIKLKNNVGEPIDVTTVTLTNDQGDDLGCTSTTGTGTWGSGITMDIKSTGCDLGAAGLIVDNKEKVLVTVMYHLAKSDSTYVHDARGEVYATVQ